MVPFNILIALRSLWKNKVYSFINIAGMGVSLACCLLIGIFIWNEWRVDRFHENYDQIYRITAKQDQAGTWYQVAVTPGPLAPELKKDFPEIREIARVGQWYGLLKVGEKAFADKKILVTEPGFFQIFSIKPILGNLGNALATPDGVVITASTAEQFFGRDWQRTQGLIGARINLSGAKDFVLMAVVEDLPTYSSMEFQVLLPIQYLFDTDPWSNKWNSNNYHTYVLGQSGLRKVELESRLTAKLKQNNPETKDQLQLQPFARQYLYSKFDFFTDWGPRSDIKYVRIFLLVGLLLMFIACVNYINLTTARAVKRSLEVGIRKVIGASRIQLLRQFLAESLLFIWIAGLLALVLIWVGSPWVARLTGWTTGTPILNGGVVAVFVVVVTILALFAGLYPAWLQSSFVPLQGLKKLALPGRRSRIRSVLVWLQFTISAVLIICTFLMFQQLRYMQRKDLGFSSAQLVNIRLNGGLMEKAQVFKQELLKNKSIADVSPSTMTMVNLENSSYLEWDGQREEEKFLITHANVDPDFIRTIGLSLVSGNNFSWQKSNDTANYIVNEQTVRKLGLTPTTVLGKEVKFWGAKGRIIGVVKDFHFKPLTTGIDPFILRYQPQDRYFRMFVKTSGGGTAEALDHIRRVYASMEKDYPIEFSFVNEMVDNQYRKDNFVANIILVFAILTIAIALLGLLGLTVYAIEQRVREMGIRKVLGASFGNIIALLMKEHIRVVVFAIAVAIPVAWYVIRQWLSNYAFRIGIGWTPFILSSIVVLILAAGTIWALGARTARANPVKSLRTE